MWLCNVQVEVYESTKTKNHWSITEVSSPTTKVKIQFNICICKRIAVRCATRMIIMLQVRVHLWQRLKCTYHKGQSSDILHWKSSVVYIYYRLKVTRHQSSHLSQMSNCMYIPFNTNRTVFMVLLFNRVHTISVGDNRACAIHAPL